jgi:acetylornithine deacetylase
MAFDLASFHRAAIETPSQDGVAEMRSLLVDTLAADGIEASVDEAGNVLAHRGPEDGAHLVFNTHIDTVPPHVPYERDGDVVRGRGACDAKGPLAAMVAAFLRADPDGRLTLAITPNEETTQTGGAHLAETLSADAYVVGEPTDLDVCIAARGQFEGQVTIRGESAHASDPATGANAIRALAPMLQALESYDETRGPGEHDLLGRPTLAPTVVEGGEAINQIPGEAALQFDRRTVPPETVDGFFEDLREHLAGWLPETYDLDVGLIRPDMPAPEAFATEVDAAVVEGLLGAGAGDPRPFGAATEASYFATDAPTVVFGPGVLADEEGPVAHAQREYVHRSAVAEAADVLEGAADSLLG